mmetsp:Transcript_90462/g.166063  ORF Transcript_90462/g.166063 Transcript_90462/m.166063 type:complete len:507 (-) Transcript_90462:84-1604(-)
MHSCFKKAMQTKAVQQQLNAPPCLPLVKPGYLDTWGATGALKSYEEIVVGEYDDANASRNVAIFWPDDFDEMQMVQRSSKIAAEGVLLDLDDLSTLPDLEEIISEPPLPGPILEHHLREPLHPLPSSPPSKATNTPISVPPVPLWKLSRNDSEGDLPRLHTSEIGNIMDGESSIGSESERSIESEHTEPESSCIHRIERQVTMSESRPPSLERVPAYPPATRQPDPGRTLLEAISRVDRRQEKTKSTPRCPIAVQNAKPMHIISNESSPASMERVPVYPHATRQPDPGRTILPWTSQVDMRQENTPTPHCPIGVEHGEPRHVISRESSPPSLEKVPVVACSVSACVCVCSKKEKVPVDPNAINQPTPGRTLGSISQVSSRQEKVTSTPHCPIPLEDAEPRHVMISECEPQFPEHGPHFLKQTDLGRILSGTQEKITSTPDGMYDFVYPERMCITSIERLPQSLERVQMYPQATNQPAAGRSLLGSISLADRRQEKMAPVARRVKAI